MVEYSEITPSAARLRNADDSLTYWAANLCIHFFTLDFLRRVCDKHERQGRTGSPFQLHIYPQKWLVVQSFGIMYVLRMVRMRQAFKVTL